MPTVPPSAVLKLPKISFKSSVLCRDDIGIVPYVPIEKPKRDGQETLFPARFLSQTLIQISGDSNDVILLQELFNIRSLNFLERLFDGDLFGKAHLQIGGLLAVAELDGRIEQRTHIIDAAPDLRHAAVDVAGRLFPQLLYLFRNKTGLFS